MLREPGPAQVLTLQRAADNRAVADWLHASNGPVLARTLPDDPTALGDYGSVREQIHFDADEVPLGALEQYFLGARASPRALYPAELSGPAARGEGT